MVYVCSDYHESHQDMPKEGQRMNWVKYCEQNNNNEDISLSNS